ncbi:MAG: HEAT repeat domain-containing protein [Planctomycetota bacterium]|nr:HEAT repeat domain-containing protein [Planctomycetota bacterium]
MRIPAGTTTVLCCAFLAGAACAEEFVYEGKTAAEWAKELKAGTNEKLAKHALSAIGKDSIPALVQLLKDPDAKARAAAVGVLAEMKLEKDSIAVVLPMLKDESYEVRRAAVQLLGRHLDIDPGAAAAVKGALNDRDKAVAEVAEEILATRIKPEEEARQRKRYDRLLADVKASVAEGDLEKARFNLEQARGLGLDDPEAREQLKNMERVIAETVEGKRKDERTLAKGRDVEQQRSKLENQKRQQFDNLVKQCQVMAEKGDIENALRVLREAGRLFPDDERSAELLKRIEAKIRARAKEQNDAPDKDARPRKRAGELDPGEAPPGNF